ncbi:MULTISPECIES: DUF1835 domain-containing protein [unclassified Pseudomonas]|uniref:DUF1835 domain-containing protein n=1 Tax=unclassified Pseudomonas TaxID=196821 RepID=UPI0008EA9261|nr:MULTISPECIES: DUF1835 domain-containing protein [unclassified Pseudomonas]PMV19652.1 DUF1835 domain-containing protein [Pseudomonas sp. DP16D-L5]PMV21463.1 DUF1835 domain-containing protein [Pseudomonas sp. FW305-3-2-15-C-TSA2]PMV36962.1 DUF1835 domain-containing protein [Pseudomonas sp. FW305-3-2-15-A-LB2]PMV44192.1 DUF1835 domain-containing protein [Pseudomonas sp. FW305-3-2-15-C-R2A1]PMV46802.1 DUF1835 domain-containing protein [Pseudomonas sp. FW305-3-2-15-C-LB1]
MSQPLNTDGRLNLEQQRKRAKELLPRLKAENPNATLSLAQWEIARQLGFSSWPKLKAHIDAIDFAARHPDFTASDEARTTHWRCGNDIAHSLQLAGFKGQFRMLADPLCMGPVRDLPRQAFRALRSAFISQAFAIDDADAARRVDVEYDHLDALASADHSVLWCEADAYDQLFLIRALAGLEQVPHKLELIEVDRIPGVQRFIGIGQLAPDVLAWLWPQRRLLEEDAVQLAKQAWSAYCDSSPVRWAQIAHDSHTALPLLAPALLRQLQELPGLHDGLSLTERLALTYLAENGPTPFGRVFAELMAKREPLPFLGDMMFHALLRPLIDGDNPLLTATETHLEWPRQVLALTALGQAVLNGDANWLDHASHVRWVGGICLRPRQPHWAIDEHIMPVWRP